jgi:hypothetical protein
MRLMACGHIPGTGLEDPPLHISRPEQNSAIIRERLRQWRRRQAAAALASAQPGIAAA